MLAAHVFSEEKALLARRWLNYRAISNSVEARRQTLGLAAEANELARSSEKAALEAMAVARRAAASAEQSAGAARTNTIIARLALVAAVIALVLAVIGLLAERKPVRPRHLDSPTAVPGRSERSD